MANNPNFSNILDKPATDVERPRPLPVGTYLTVIQGLPRYDKSSKKQTDFVEFTHQIVSALDDVDPDELAAAGGLTLRDAVEATANTEVCILIRHEASQDGKAVFARISDTASAA